MDRLFLTRAQDMRLLTRAQVLEVYHELGMRRYREPDLQAWEVVVDKGWIGNDVAMTLLEAAPDESLGNLEARISGSQELVPSEGEEIELTDSEFHSDVAGELAAETEHDGFSAGAETLPEGFTAAGDTLPEAVFTETQGDAEDYDYAQVPKFVEPLAPSYAVSDSSSEDSVLEMELPPPQSASGDSLFDENDSQPRVPALDADGGPEIVSENTPSVVYHGEALDAADVADLDSVNLEAAELVAETPGDELAQVMDPSDTLDDLDGVTAPEVLAEDERPPSITARDWSGEASDTATDSGRRQRAAQKGSQKGPAETSGRTARDWSGRQGANEPMPVAASLFDVKGAKGADVDFASFGEDGIRHDPEMIEESEEISVAMHDSAVNDVMDDADDGYFGPAADLTMTPAEVLEDSLIPAKPLTNTTLFDSEQLQELANESDIVVADEDSDFAITSPPDAPGAPRRATGPLSEVRDESDVDFGSTMPPADDSGLVAADVGMTDATDEATSLAPGQAVTTSSKTQFATGEMALPGLGKNRSKVGVESNITGDEVTLADLRQQMGLGAGVKLGEQGHGALSRLRKVGGLKKRYSVIREIARGGMGKVIEVEDNDLRRSVALKVLRKEMLERKDLVERFLEEAQITGQLEHPNIVPVHEIGVDGRGNLYFTMKLVEGEDLNSILKRLRKKDPGAIKAFPLSRLVDIFIKACEGIAFAHSKGVIHRDLKPANIMVGRYGEVQIMDWGVAKIVGRKEDTGARSVASDRQDDDASRTMAGSLLGTPSYMSPEQARGEVNNMAGQSDIFSLGVILYELLAMRTPWTAQTSAAVLDQVKSYDPEPPSKIAPERKIPPELEQLAMKCIEKRADKRVQSAQDLIENLRSWQEGRTLAAVQYTVGQLLGKWIGRHKAAFVAGLLIIGALIGGIALTFNVIEQGNVSRANDLVAKAKTSRDTAVVQLTSGDFDAARKLASEAREELSPALDILARPSEAHNIYEELADIRRDADTAFEQAEQKRIDERAEEERLRNLNEALEAARSVLETAKAKDQDREVPRNEVVMAFNDARDAFLRVQAVDRENADAKVALVEIATRQQEFEVAARQEKDMLALRQFVPRAREMVSSALARPRNNEEYRAATTELNEAVSICDQAIFVPVTGVEADKLKAEAQELKVRASLDFARRAMENSSFDVAELMLARAKGVQVSETLVQEVERTQAELTALVQARSRFRGLLEAAERRYNAKEWVQAQADLNLALNEARQSTYATDADRENLARMLESSRLEEVLAEADSAGTSGAMTRSIRRLDQLIEGDDKLQLPDYVSRALSRRDVIREAAVGQLSHEAAEALAKNEETVAATLYTQALQYARPGSPRESEIHRALTEIKMRLVGKQATDRERFLERDFYVVGSNRESDQNSARTRELKEFVFVGRYLVTNQEFKDFVDKGGYTDRRFWDQQAIPLLESGTFVDTTGKPGPAGWVDGGFDPSLARYPVTGVSWFEASAYARWLGNGSRLPSPDEWEIAAGAPRVNAPNTSEYGFPLTDAPVPVAEPRPVGSAAWDASPLGVRDMGNNVAEWTSGQRDGAAVVKGSEPGMKTELFLRYARRTKNSVADPAERSLGRGFRCAREMEFSEGKD